MSKNKIWYYYSNEILSRSKLNWSNHVSTNQIPRKFFEWLKEDSTQSHLAWIPNLNQFVIGQRKSASTTVSQISCQQKHYPHQQSNHLNSRSSGRERQRGAIRDTLFSGSSDTVGRRSLAGTKERVDLGREKKNWSREAFVVLESSGWAD